MTIQWLGHACFAIRHKGYTIIIDPYNSDYTAGYPKLRLKADLVLVSHEHFGHNYREWNGRYFNEVRMYKCEKVGGVAQQPEQEKPAEQPKPQQAQMDFEEKGKDDDLPF